jgi:hypothetical protein
VGLDALSGERDALRHPQSTALATSVRGRLAVRFGAAPKLK